MNYTTRAIIKMGILGLLIMQMMQYYERSLSLPSKYVDDDYKKAHEILYNWVGHSI